MKRFKTQELVLTLDRPIIVEVDHGVHTICMGREDGATYFSGDEWETRARVIEIQMTNEREVKDEDRGDV